MTGFSSLPDTSVKPLWAAGGKNLNIHRAASYNQYQPSAPVGQPFSVAALEKRLGMGYIQVPFSYSDCRVGVAGWLSR
jgi:hypothetical protein